MSRGQVRVGIVEDQPLFRDMLLTTLGATQDITVVAAAGTVAEATQRFTASEPDGCPIDVALLDIDLPDGNGISFGVQLQRRHPTVKIVLLSAHNMMELLLDLPRDVGGWSYLSKTSSTSATTLVQTVLSTARGRTVLDPALVEASRPRPGTAVARLTDRQYQVLRLLATGLSNPGIGERLGITEKSVQNHINTIYGALGIEPDPSFNPRVRAALTLLEESGIPES